MCVTITSLDLPGPAHSQRSALLTALTNVFPPCSTLVRSPTTSSDGGPAGRLESGGSDRRHRAPHYPTSARIDRLRPQPCPARAAPEDGFIPLPGVSGLSAILKASMGAFDRISSPAVGTDVDEAQGGGQKAGWRHDQGCKDFFHGMSSLGQVRRPGANLQQLTVEASNLGEAMPIFSTSERASIDFLERR